MKIFNSIPKKPIRGAVLLLLTTALILFSLPEIYRFIISKPSSPFFEISKFTFSNYYSEDELRKVLITLFPVGTPRDSVEEVLMKHANLKARLKRMQGHQYFVIYSEKNKEAAFYREGFRYTGLREAKFTYDGENLVTAINVQILTGKPTVRFIGGDVIQQGEDP